MTLPAGADSVADMLDHDPKSVVNELPSTPRLSLTMEVSSSEGKNPCVIVPVKLAGSS
jgi:hypothetical protein